MATAAQSQVSAGAVTTISSPRQVSAPGAGIDFAHARAMPMPAARTLPPSALAAVRNAMDPALVFGQPGSSSGGEGDGLESPVQLVPAQDLHHGRGVEPEEFGTPGQPYTTSEANAFGDYTANFYPFRAAGKLFFMIGTRTFLCSASLIKPGIVVTAAHCVANYGMRQFYSGWVYVPAYNNGTAPYGTWTGASARVLTAYSNGTDNCFQFGVICPDNVALITLNAQSGSYPGTTTGWFAYGWNGYSFNGSSQALITQLGYPVKLDNGGLMQRTDSQGFTDVQFSRNTIIGSLQTGGSSGGPWLVNLGLAPSLNGTSFGTAPNHNVVVGVTSWGFTNLAIKQQGASPFTTGNITVLVSASCSVTPSAC
jgi:hypothetical protein